eukprot:11069589-Alexandrium_andersonii.AAC.1
MRGRARTPSSALLFARTVGVCGCAASAGPDQGPGTSPKGLLSRLSGRRRRARRPPGIPGCRS